MQTVVFSNRDEIRHRVTSNKQTGAFHLEVWGSKINGSQHSIITFAISLLNMKLITCMSLSCMLLSTWSLQPWNMSRIQQRALQSQHIQKIKGVGFVFNLLQVWHFFTCTSFNPPAPPDGIRWVCEQWVWFNIIAEKREYSGYIQLLLLHSYWINWTPTQSSSGRQNLHLVLISGHHNRFNSRPSPASHSRFCVKKKKTLTNE